MIVPLAVLVIVALLFVWVLAFGRGSSPSAAQALADGVRDNRFQAVYMSNDRVYFGKLRARDNGGLELRNAFFLRQAQTDDDAQESASSEVVSVEIEVGGDGTLLIGSDQVVLVQNLKSDSDIARAIEDALES